MLSQATKVSGLGLAVFLGGLFVVPACGSDDNGGAGNGGGAPSGGMATGGNSTATGGTGGTATGGVATGGVATGGVAAGGVAAGGVATGGVATGGVATGGVNAGGTPQVAAACKGAVPKEALISDFTGVVAPVWGEGTADTDFSGGFFTYPAAPITLSFAGNVLTASGNVATYSGFGLYVTYCGDASFYDGVKFKISGNAGATGSATFYVQTNVAKWADGLKGTCLAPKANEYSDCVYPSVAITGITATPKEVTILWTDVTGGKPAAGATTDGSDIIGFQWAFDWMVGTPEYAASLVIDDMEFLGAGSGTGGAGGAGSGGAGGAM